MLNPPPGPAAQPTRRVRVRIVAPSDLYRSDDVNVPLVVMSNTHDFECVGSVGGWNLSLLLAEGVGELMYAQQEEPTPLT
jgi:hypothetical protein